MNAVIARAFLSVLLVASPMVSPAAAPPVRVQGVALVLDGDTLDVQRPAGGADRVRLHGIDAAELSQGCPTARGRPWRCGAAARERLAQLADQRVVDCAIRGRDEHDRLIGVCSVRGGSADVGAQLVAEGQAWAFLRYSDDYAAQERRARRDKVGIWQAAAQPPWVYRTERWRAAVQVAPLAGCPIKGNINAGGERIYHTPWSPWYERTSISAAKGERWFCDEAEALAAGWREARFR